MTTKNDFGLRDMCETISEKILEQTPITKEKIEATISSLVSQCYGFDTPKYRFARDEPGMFIQDYPTVRPLDPEVGGTSKMLWDMLRTNYSDLEVQVHATQPHWVSPTTRLADSPAHNAVSNEVRGYFQNRFDTDEVRTPLVIKPEP